MKLLAGLALAFMYALAAGGAWFAWTLVQQGGSLVPIGLLVLVPTFLLFGWATMLVRKTWVQGGIRI